MRAEGSFEPRGETRKVIVRLGIPAGALFVALVVVAIWWDAPPVEAPDLVPQPAPPVADQANGWVLFDGPAVTIDARWHEARFMRWLPEAADDDASSYHFWDDRLAAGLLADHGDLLARADEAIDRPAWRFPAWEIGDSVPELETLGTVIAVKQIEIDSLRSLGSEEQAVEAAIALAVLGRRIMGSSGPLGAWTIGVRCQLAGTGKLSMIAARCDDRPALAKLLRERDDWMPAPGESLVGLQYAFQLEFQSRRQLLARHGRRFLTHGSDASPQFHWSMLFFKPNQTAALDAAVTRESISNVDRSPADRRYPLRDEVIAFPDTWRDHLHLNFFGRQFVGAMAILFHASPFLEADIDLRLKQGATVILAALRLHAIDHGTLPPTLDALVPAYLDALPADPWCQAAFRYDPSRRVFWSVGDDFRDDGGDPDSPRDITTTIPE